MLGLINVTVGIIFWILFCFLKKLFFNLHKEHEGLLLRESQKGGFGLFFYCGFVDMKNRPLKISKYSCLLRIHEMWLAYHCEGCCFFCLFITHLLNPSS